MRDHLIKTIAAAAMSICALGAQAQHAVTVTISGNDRAVVTLLNDGLADIVGAEIFAGTPADGRITFAGTGTDGLLGAPYADHFGMTTWTPDLQPSETAAYAINLDAIRWSDGTTFASSVTSPFSYSSMRAEVTWADGFYARIPMSRGLADGLFSFTDIPPIAAPVPEPEAGLTMLAGLLLLLVPKVAADRRREALRRCCARLILQDRAGRVQAKGRAS